jgi:hypothetical protein
MRRCIAPAVFAAYLIVSVGYAIVSAVYAIV